MYSFVPDSSRAAVFDSTMELELCPAGSHPRGFSLGQGADYLPRVPRTSATFPCALRWHVGPFTGPKKFSPPPLAPPGSTSPPRAAAGLFRTRVIPVQMPPGSLGGLVICDSFEGAVATAGVFAHVRLVSAIGE